MRFPLFFLFLLTPILVQGQHTWTGGIGDYNDVSKWDKGSLPSAIDDVIINAGTVRFPDNYVAQAKDFFAENCTLEFMSSGSNHGSIAIHGDITLMASANTAYASNSGSEWLLMGANTLHQVDSKAIDLLELQLEEESSSITLLSDFLASKATRIVSGSLNSTGFDIETGLFVLGSGCGSQSGCSTKELNLQSCTITCTEQWTANSNFGSFFFSVCFFPLCSPSSNRNNESTVSSSFVTKTNLSPVLLCTTSTPSD